MNMDLPSALENALNSLQSGQPEQCLRLCNAILADHPETIEAYYLRGCAAYHVGDLGASVSDLEFVHSSQPHHLHAAYYFGRSLRAAGRTEEALAPLQAASAEKALEVHARYELAHCLARLRRRAEAIGHYSAILGLEPGNAQVAANLAALLERENRLDEAEEWTGKALAMDPDNETAEMTRAVLDRRSGRYRQAAERLRHLIPRIEHPVNRSIAWNHLGQCLEAGADWDQAFEAFTESNRILRSHHPHSRPDPRSPHSLETLERIHNWLRERPMDSWICSGDPDAGGIAFLVGFPRSGTTLLDRMLSAHPDIEVLEEKSLFSGLHQDWWEPGTLEGLAVASEAQIADARTFYIREMSRHRSQPQKSLLIDKLPLNLAYLFLIYRLFPRAPVIFLQRHPADACLSCFFQAFELVASMAYFLDIRDTARYYDAVMQIAVLSLDQVGNPVHHLRYEDLATAPENQLRALLHFLSREWDDSVLKHHQQADRAVSNTPSYQQVLHPLHTRSIGKWRHYAARLEPCLPILKPWIERWGYEQDDILATKPLDI